MAEQVLTGIITPRATENHTREIRVLAGKTVLLHPKHIKRNKRGEVDAIVVSPQEKIPNSCPIRVPLRYLSIDKKTYQQITNL